MVNYGPSLISSNDFKPNPNPPWSTSEHSSKYDNGSGLEAGYLLAGLDTLPKHMEEGGINNDT